VNSLWSGTNKHLQTTSRLASQLSDQIFGVLHYAGGVFCHNVGGFAGKNKDSMNN
jgi:myosin heavy subunit